MVRTRGNTPQAQVATVAPVAQMRAKRTRSQSIEPSASTSTASQTARPRTARLGGPLQRAGILTLTGKAVGSPSPDLSIVEEKDTSDAENEPVETTTGPRVSISGTTARSTVSSEDEEIGPEPGRLLLENAPDLCHAADRLIQVLTIPHASTKTTTIKDILRDLDKPSSITAKKLWPLAQNFDNLFRQCGDENEDRFLNPQKLVEAIFEPHSPPSLDSKSWGVTELVYSANLAYLGKWVANAPRSEPEIVDFLEDLNKTCPQPFLASLMEGSTFGNSELQDETFEFSLAIRAQLAVMRLINEIAENEFDPETIVQSIRSVFYAQLESGGYSEETLRAWNFNGIGAGATGLLPEYDQEIRKTIASIQAGATFDVMAITAGESKYMQALVSEFPWSAFRLRVLNWIGQRQQELNRKIKRLGGVTAILDTVKQDIGLEATMLESSPKNFDSFGSTLADRSPKRPKTKKFGPDFYQKMEAFRKRHSGGVVEQQADGATTPEVEPSTGPEVVSAAEVEATINSLPYTGDQPNPQQPKKQNPRRIREQMTSSGRAPNPTAGAQPESPRSKSPMRHQLQPAADVVVADEFTPVENFEEDMVESEPGPSQAPRSQIPPATQGKELIKKYQAKRRQDKENRLSRPARPRAFIDPQEETERVVFDEETQEHQSQQVASKRPGSVSRGKRPAPVEADENEDVSEDEGFQNDSRDIGNRSQRRQPTSVAPRSNGHPNQPPPKRAWTASQTTRSSNARAPRGPSLDPESEEDDEPDSTNHKQVKAIARRNVALAKMGVEPRRRKAWTRAEEAQLQSLIADYGTSWTELKKMDEADGNILADRDQVALKDKARNMKMAFLKARLDLPVNFEYVPLDKKGRDMLDALGIEY
ncbi:chromatin binding [Venturia nashicola]|uniref:Chromatin binding n=1 Tax=Venturia nashicola TaxID=86259 RepID=A0A4Z1PIM5_9PEZI|nr:chromatin binding [Venturia nashicola]TLD37698.1 chromatin binding [Venturia nashicola]